MEENHASAFYMQNGNGRPFTLREIPLSPAKLPFFA